MGNQSQSWLWSNSKQTLCTFLIAPSGKQGLSDGGAVTMHSLLLHKPGDVLGFMGLTHPTQGTETRPSNNILLLLSFLSIAVMVHVCICLHVCICTVCTCRSQVVILQTAQS